MNHVTHPVSPVDISNFLMEISKFCYYQKCMYRLHFDRTVLILLTVFGSLKIFLIKKVLIMMMSAKMATPGFLKLAVF